MHSLRLNPMRQIKLLYFFYIIEPYFSESIFIFVRHTTFYYNRNTMKLYKIIAIYTKLTDIVKNNAFISVGNISAIFTLNFYYDEYWEPIIYIISSLLIFFLCIHLYYRWITPKGKDKKNTNPNLIKSKEILVTVSMTFLFFILPYIYNIHSEHLKKESLIANYENIQKHSTKISSIYNSLKKGTIIFDESKVDTNNTAYLTACGIYLNDLNVGNFKLAFKYLNMAAARGDAIAWLNLGNMYMAGHNTAVNEIKAFRAFKKSADLGYPGAMFNVGYFLSREIGTEKDLNKALKYYLDAAICGNTDAMIEAGNIYGFNKKRDKWKYWYSQAADHGDVSAYRWKAQFYLEEGKYKKALEWGMKALEGKNYKAYGLLGHLYQYGKGVEKDIQHAEKCYLLQVKCYPEEEAPIQNLAHFYYEIGDSAKYKHWSQEQQRIDSMS